jgi:hypothetical protein
MTDWIDSAQPSVENDEAAGKRRSAREVIKYPPNMGHPDHQVSPMAPRSLPGRASPGWISGVRSLRSGGTAQPTDRASDFRGIRIRELGLLKEL